MLDNDIGTRSKKKRLMIIGAGEASAMVLKEISKRADSEYLPICIIDDDRSKIGRSILGTKVYGSTYEIPQICKNENIEIILFSIIGISQEDKKRLDLIPSSVKWDNANIGSIINNKNIDKTLQEKTHSKPLENTNNEKMTNIFVNLKYKNEQSII